MRRKRIFSLPKRRKWQFLRTLELDVLILFVKYRWRLEWRIIQNMILKHQNFHNFAYYSQIIQWEENAFQPAKTQKTTISQDVRILNFEVIFEEQMTSHIKKCNKRDFETSEISSFYFPFVENSMWRNLIFNQPKGRKWKLPRT
jgi:hypothetical protein